MNVNETKLKERVLKRIITFPTLGKIKKKRSTVPNLLRVHRTSRYTTCVRKSPVVEVLA